jgi:putative PIN family toxin of toxin-antitoxin system
MPRRRKIKAIIDTNLFISFLIGKKLGSLKDSIIKSNIILFFAEQNIEELLIVTARDKFRKYFGEEDVKDLVSFIKIVGEVIEIDGFEEICRDPKDDFLLALAKESKAHYLISGDKDLLELKEYKKTQIITINQFEQIIKEHNA